MAEETTNPIDGDNIEAVAASLFETPQNPENEETETVEATEDTQTEAVEEPTDEQDDIEASSDIDENIDDAEEVEAESQDVYDMVFEVPVDGKTESRTVKELIQGFSGQKYIQKGMAENAENRKALDEERSSLDAEKAQFAQRMTEISKITEQLQNGDLPKIVPYPDQSLQITDPMEFNLQAENHRRSVDERNAWVAKYNQAEEERFKIEKEQNDRFVANELSKVGDWWPEFADPSKRESLLLDLKKETMEVYGFSDADMATVRTNGELRIMSDALKYRKILAQKDTAKQKAAKAPPVKATNKRVAAAGKARDVKDRLGRMRETGSVDDVAKFLEM